MPANHQFEYLPLVLREHGPARFPQAPQPENPTTIANRSNRPVQGLKDLVLNYPYVFEVAEPDDIETPQQITRDLKVAQAHLSILPPDPTAPAVCVIDSGIQEEHFWLEPGIDKASSFCFLPGVSDSDVADYVPPGGHGTRVAGAVLHGEVVPKSGEIALESWVQNARVLDNGCQMPQTLHPAAVLREVVKRYHEGNRNRKTRIFNHSINADAPCRMRHMSSYSRTAHA